LSSVINICNITVGIFFAFFIYTLLIGKRLKNKFKNINGETFTYSNVKTDNDYAVFLATYIFPFLSIRINEFQDLFVFFSLLIFLGILLMKTNDYYRNPTLALMGYKIYSAEISIQGGSRIATVISKQEIKENDKLLTAQIDQMTPMYYAKQSN